MLIESDSDEAAPAAGPSTVSESKEREREASESEEQSSKASDDRKSQPLFSLPLTTPSRLVRLQHAGASREEAPATCELAGEAWK